MEKEPMPILGEDADPYLRAMERQMAFGRAMAGQASLRAFGSAGKLSALCFTWLADELAQSVKDVHAMASCENAKELADAQMAAMVARLQRYRSQSDELLELLQGATDDDDAPEAAPAPATRRPTTRDAA